MAASELVGRLIVNYPAAWIVVWRDRQGRRQEARLPGDDEPRAAQYAADHHGTYHAAYRLPASQGSAVATATIPTATHTK